MDLHHWSIVGLPRVRPPFSTWLTPVLFITSMWVIIFWWLANPDPRFYFAGSLLILTSWLQAVSQLRLRQHYRSRIFLLQSLVRRLTNEREDQAIQITQQWQTAAVLQSLGFFTAAVLHNISGPLSTLAALLSEVRPQLSNQQYCDFNASVHYVLSVVRHARQNLRQETVLWETVRVAEIMRETKDLVRNLALARGLRIQIICDENLMVQGDSVLLRQILLNLVQNSIEAIGEAASGLITLQGKIEQRQAIVEIIDNGPGMNAEQIRLLGRRFYSSKRHGSGLGIAFIRDILPQRFGGTCKFYSQPGIGTTARITFSLAETPRTKLQ